MKAQPPNLEEQLEPHLTWREAIQIIELGNISMGLVMLETLMLKYPDFALPYFSLGTFCEDRLQAFDEAIGHYARCLELDPKHEDARIRLANLYFQAAHYDQARQIIESGLEQVSLTAQVQIRLFYGKMEEALGRLPQAMRQYRAAFQHASDPNTWQLVNAALERLRTKGADFGDDTPCED